MHEHRTHKNCDRLLSSVQLTENQSNFILIPALKDNFECRNCTKILLDILNVSDLPQTRVNSIYWVFDALPQFLRFHDARHHEYRNQDLKVPKSDQEDFIFMIDSSYITPINERYPISILMQACMLHLIVRSCSDAVWIECVAVRARAKVRSLNRDQRHQHCSTTLLSTIITTTSTSMPVHPFTFSNTSRTRFPFKQVDAVIESPRLAFLRADHDQHCQRTRPRATLSGCSSAPAPVLSLYGASRLRLLPNWCSDAAESRRLVVTAGRVNNGSSRVRG